MDELDIMTDKSGSYWNNKTLKDPDQSDLENETSLNTTHNHTNQHIHYVITMDTSCRMFEFSMSFIMVGVTCLFGFIGNILSILTLRRDATKSVTTFLLSALAVADFAFLVPTVFVIMIPTYCEFYQHCTGIFVVVIPYVEQFGWAIASTCHTCTVYVTVLVAIHRYLWVCRLHLAQQLSGEESACLPLNIISN
jgi:hypothetical protein